MLRGAQNLSRGARLDDPAAVHHDEVFGALGCQTKVVGNEEHGVAQLLGEVLQVVQDGLLNSYIQRGGGLVGDE